MCYEFFHVSPLLEDEFEEEPEVSVDIAVCSVCSERMGKLAESGFKSGSPHHEDHTPKIKGTV